MSASSANVSGTVPTGCSASNVGAEVLEDQTRGPAGIYSVVRDPGGATIALWQKA